MATPRRLSVDGIEINVDVQGDGEPVVLLHGFPDSHALYRLVVPELVAAGHRSVALDQRGFGESDAPIGRRHYTLAQAADDTLLVMDALGIERAHLVGHDWGAAVGWVLAGNRPDRFLSFSAISLGHSKAFGAGGVRQLLRAWYVLVILIPGLAEWLVRSKNWWLLRVATRRHPEAERWSRDLSRPGRLTAAFNWYRANALAPPRHPNPTLPVFGIWSDGDVALTEAQMTASKKFVDGPFRYQRFEGASHWLPLDAPRPLAAALVEFFRSTSRTGPA